MAKEFDYEKLTLDDRLKIHQALADTTLKHVDASGGLFESLGYDEAQYHSQALEVTHLHPVPVDKEEVGFLANAARPNLFRRTREVLAEQAPFVSAARFLLDHQTVNIFPVSNHSTIEDIAIWSAAWSEQLDEDSWQEQNGMIISRGVTTIGAFSMAASQVVQKAGHVFMSFPRTKTIEDLNIDNELVATNNRTMRKEVHAWLGEDLIHKFRRNRLGKTLNIAWSGKTDKMKYDSNNKPENMSLGKIGTGTLDVIKRGLVLPIVLWEGDEPFVELGELTRVESPADALKVQMWQREVLSKATGLPTDKIEIEQ